MNLSLFISRDIQWRMTLTKMVKYACKMLIIIEIIEKEHNMSLMGGYKRKVFVIKYVSDKNSY